jgi:hypothetical protein
MPHANRLSVKKRYMMQDSRYKEQVIGDQLSVIGEEEFRIQDSRFKIIDY